MNVSGLTAGGDAPRDERGYPRVWSGALKREIRGFDDIPGLAGLDWIIVKPF